MNRVLKIAETVNRKRAKEQGFYDGRFRTRTFSDKKKTEYLKLRRNKKVLY
jgi:hypothetical protein